MQSHTHLMRAPRRQGKALGVQMPKCLNFSLFPSSKAELRAALLANFVEKNGAFTQAGDLCEDGKMGRGEQEGVGEGAGWR